MKTPPKKDLPEFDFTMRVLIVDDMSAMRKMLSTMCKELGFFDIIG